MATPSTPSTTDVAIARSGSISQTRLRPRPYTEPSERTARSVREKKRRPSSWISRTSSRVSRSPIDVTRIVLGSKRKSSRPECAQMTASTRTGPVSTRGPTSTPGPVSTLGASKPESATPASRVGRRSSLHPMARTRRAETEVDATRSMPRSSSTLRIRPSTAGITPGDALLHFRRMAQARRHAHRAVASGRTIEASRPFGVP